MRFQKLFFAVSVLITAALPAETFVVSPIQGLPHDFIRGADISMLSQIEECGGKYYDLEGNEQDLIAILKRNGVNWVRLRLWHNPLNAEDVVENGRIVSRKGEPAGGGNNSLDRTISMAKRAKAAGLKVLLDIHYSDFWADPDGQNKPAAWKDLDFGQLQKAVYEYTAEVMKKMTAAGVCPDMVQTGNELNNGMLWPDGKIWPAENEKAGGMSNFIKLLQQGIQAVRDNTPGGSYIKIVIHLADGGDNSLYRSVFDPLEKAKLDYDVIGLSFYPYWHGSVAGLSANVSDLVRRYGKDIVIAETAYAFTEDDADEKGNVFRIYSDTENGYLATVQGQATAVRDVMNIVFTAAGQNALGVFYWAPEWIPVKGAGWRTNEGNNWENQAMFDFTGRELASLGVFRRVYDQKPADVRPYSFEPYKTAVVPGSAPRLPAKVKIIYSDDALRAGEIVWDTHDFSSEHEERTFTLGGTLKGTSFRVAAEISVSDRVNLATDSSWESGTFGEWKLNGPAAASFPENNRANAHSGDWSYKYWSASPFKTTLTRTFTGIPNGTYTLSVWAMGGGGEKAVKLFATNSGTGKTPSVLIENTGWKEWKQYSIPSVAVTDNQCTIGIFIDANADNWGNFDDVEFYLNK